ncbi:undecaprenyldiphospho-muramoylpentapeptide beta-N-acetylglucosaminyltransferase [bacterium]|nr:undecaprenyldiphospho-muramoylpentapeptide beta-N-acetylglucosaminyltransferase [bacterium]
MRVAIAGGGTGGHLFPGIAVAEALVARDASSRVLFCCTARDGAYARLDEQGFDVEVLPGSSRGPLPRRLLSLGAASVRAMGLLRRFRPDVVVGLGGYGSLAPVLCARMRRTPVVLLEQNVVPGRSNRFLERFATEIECQWPESRERFRRPARVRVTGNPVRRSIRRLDRADAARELGMEPDVPTVLVFGGSQGARPLNELAMAAMPLFASAERRVQFIHLAGQDDGPRVEEAYARHGLVGKVFGFLADMSLAYSACDLVFSRAGGTSIAEFAALGLPSMLVPLPHAADDHQALNAAGLAERGGAIVCAQAELSGESLWRGIEELLGAPEQLAAMAEACRESQLGDTSGRVAERIERVGSGIAGGSLKIAAEAAHMAAGR